MNNTIYDEVTNRIIERLEQGTIPWLKPWHTTNTLDKNIKTGNEYNGINRLILGMSGFNCNIWGSFKQWQDLGAQVKKGQHGTRIVFFYQCFNSPKVAHWFTITVWEWNCDVNIFVSPCLNSRTSWIGWRYIFCLYS